MPACYHTMYMLVGRRGDSVNCKLILLLFPALCRLYGRCQMLPSMGMKYQFVLFWWGGGGMTLCTVANNSKLILLYTGSQLYGDGTSFP